MRVFVLLYAAVAYAIAMLNIAYIFGFLIDFLVPKSINSGATEALIQSLCIDFVLVLAFGLQHSLTARRSFKRWWLQYIPQSMERATYLYMTAAMTFLLVYFWQPVPIVVWQIETPFVYWGVLAAYTSVWVLMFSATFPIGHFSFFGLAQAWHVQGKQPAFTVRWLYALIRHPISLGWMITPWITPFMTLGQLTFAFATLLYIWIATMFEEADLSEELGEVYRSYKKAVPAFIPNLRK
ncbi:methyltransferase family protein [Pseudovibrio sp. Alg231-02]|uniref:methyltransferase family protein n=1 Tax=Pseudovibrio sp. Alg231-02 TaxID=1922223 RepID=UPI000D54E1F5|nr:hypothetical protein [Pseudovibrio sp. Alg231-02]